MGTLLGSHPFRSERDVPTALVSWSAQRTSFRLRFLSDRARLIYFFGTSGADAQGPYHPAAGSAPFSRAHRCRATRDIDTPARVGACASGPSDPPLLNSDRAAYSAETAAKQSALISARQNDTFTSPRFASGASTRHTCAIVTGELLPLLLERSGGRGPVNPAGLSPQRRRRAECLRSCAHALTPMHHAGLATRNKASVGRYTRGIKHHQAACRWWEP